MGLSKYAKYGSAAAKLSSAVKSGIVSHAYICEGNNNIDKIGFAKAFSQALICRQMPGEGCGRCVECRKIADGNYEDMFIVEPEDTTERKTGTNSIKDADVEELQVRLKQIPSAGDHNIAIVSGADSMTIRAQTRFLKTLEEPPAGTVIMLLSENSEELLPTINSRCVNVRLYDIDGKDNNDETVLAGKVFSMIRDNSYFSDIKAELDNVVKTRQDAYSFVDAMEAVIGNIARNSEGAAANAGALRASTELIEETRRDIKLGAGYNYRIRSMVLGIQELFRSEHE